MINYNVKSDNAAPLSTTGHVGWTVYNAHQIKPKTKFSHKAFLLQTHVLFCVRPAGLINTLLSLVSKGYIQNLLVSLLLLLRLK